MEMAGRILTVMLLSGNDRKTVYQDFQKEGQSCHLQAAGYRIDIRDRAEVKMVLCVSVLRFPVNAWNLRQRQRRTDRIQDLQFPCVLL